MAIQARLSLSVFLFTCQARQLGVRIGVRYQGFSQVPLVCSNSKQE